jgi:hypothetical protein
MKDSQRLAQLTADKATQALLLPPVPQTKSGFGTNASVDYYLPAKAGSVEVTILNERGEEMGEAKGDADAGFQHVSVNLSHEPFGTFPGMIFWSGFPRAIAAPPGTYQIRLTVDGKSQTKPLIIRKDPRLTATEKDLQEQYQFAVEISERINDANEAVMRIRDMKEQIDKAAADPKADADLKSKAEALKGKLTSIEGEIYQYRSRSGQDPLNYPIKLNDQMAGVLSFVLSGQRKPPQQSRDVFAKLDRKLDAQLRALSGLESRDVGDFNKVLSAKGISPIVPKTPPLQRGGGRRGGREEEEEG